MELTSTDYRTISEQIENGKNYIEFEKGNEVLTFECTLERDGYFEDDYYNGTGAFIETSRDFWIENLACYDEDGKETVTDFKEDELLSWID